MAKAKVFVTRVIPDAGLEKVQHACDAEIWPEPLPPPPEVLREKVSRCEGILATLNDRIDASMLKNAPNLRVISNFAVGFNNIDIPVATELGIPVGNTPDVLTDATADMAFCLMIAAARRLVDGDRFIHAGKWRTWEPMGHIGQDLMEKTLGVVGMGRIGFALAKRAHLGWDMRIVYSDVRNHEQADSKLGAKRLEFDDLLKESDFVSVHTDLNDKTRGLFDRSAFSLMKPTAVFVNTARGPIHVQRDLVEALTRGEIFAAGLDVTDPEPVSMDDPILELPNAIVAPHIASATTRTRNSMAEIAADNLIAGVEGKKLRTCVNPEVESNRRK